MIGENLEVTATMSRKHLLRRATRDGAGVWLAGSLAGALAGSAAADTLSDGDLAYARLLVGAELLAADFYGLAIAAKQFDGVGSKYLR